MSATMDEIFDAEAARVALVALFGMVPSYEPLDEDRVRISPDAAVLSRDRAARLLASMPKPLICYAESVNGVLEVSCELLAEVADNERFERTAGADDREDLFDEIADRYGEDDTLLVGAFGRGESAFVSLASARRWLRDYEIEYATSRADDTNNPKMTSSPFYDEALRHGAKAILQFESLAARVATIDGADFPFPLPESASLEDRRRVERSFTEMAKHLLLEINEADELAAVERDLVERSEIPADSADNYSNHGDGYMHKMIASQMRKFFEHRELPAECAAFIDACRED
ncbi:MAG: hypothetical protein ABI884_00020 [Gemmatimonadota bacterium]